MGSLPEQHFTFANPISETYDDAQEFDYEAWIEQSKSSYSAILEEKSYAASLDGEAIKRHHQEMVLQGAEDTHEDDYELSLADITELSKAEHKAQETGEKREASGNVGKSWRKSLSRGQSLEGAGIILKMFMPSPSGGRKKNLRASPEVPTKSASVHVDGSTKNMTAEMAKEPINRRSNSMSSKGNKDNSYNRKSIGCYPFFNNSRHKVKRKTGGQYCI